MTDLRATILLFSIIFIEGYIVLSSELLAIRQTIPYVGSGTDTVSIIIAAVLMPLAFGYHAGGEFIPGHKNGRYTSIRDKLIKNLIISQVILFFGLSHFTLDFFFQSLFQEDVTSRILLTAIYAGAFLVVPVYLLGQTIPLISNYFSKEKLAHITGSILFFSTLGSFAGAIVSTLFLMSTIGVHYTAALNFILLAILITLLRKKKHRKIMLWTWALAISGTLINSGFIMQSFNIVENNTYNTIQVVEKNAQRHLILNRNYSSMMDNQGRRHAYVEFIDRIALKPISNASPAKNILVIGAGGFTVGHRDKNNIYDFVDIDGSLQEVAENHILKEKLAENKTFHPVPARAYLSQTDTKYDVIILDAYLGAMSIPEHLVTQEFFQQVRAALNTNGVVIANFASSAAFNNPFSRHIDNTFRTVFPHTSRHAIHERYNLWSGNTNNDSNVMYIYKHHPDAKAQHLYTDNKNTLFLDKPGEILKVE